MKAYQIIAQSFEARENCIKSNNREWLARHEETIAQICDLVMPHGSGLDGKYVSLDLDRSKPNRLVFSPLDFHHMNENGFYNGWSAHDLIVTPGWNGPQLKITGPDRNQIKDYLYDCFSYALNLDLAWDKDSACYVIDEKKAA